MNPPPHLPPPPLGPEGERWRALAAIALWSAAALLTLYPIFTVSIPALVDYPNHVARLFILAAADRIPALEANYQVTWAFQPNLAMDLVVPPLVGALSVFDASRLFLAVTILLPGMGTVMLYRAIHGRHSAWTAAAFLFSYNLALAGGFLNFLFGIGLYLLAFAAWIASRRWRPAAKIALFSAVTVILYVSHFFSVAVFGLSIAAYEGWRLWRAGTLASPKSTGGAMAVVLVPFLPVAVLWGLKPAGPENLLTQYGDFSHKAAALAAPVRFSGGSLDVIFFVLVAVFFLVGWRAGRLRLAPTMKATLLILVLAAAVMPTKMLGAALADVRLPLVLAFLLVAAFEFTPRGRLLPLVGTAILLALLMARSVEVSAIWRRAEANFTEFRQAARALPPGIRLMLAMDRSGDGPELPDTHLYAHLAALSVIDTCAFVPLLATIPDQQPIAASSRNTDVDTGTGMPVSMAQLAEGADAARSRALRSEVPINWQRPYWAGWPERFDYVAVIRARGGRDNPDPRHLKPFATGSYFDLYAVKPGGPGPIADCL